MVKPAVFLDGIVRRFGAVTALDHLSCSIPRGVFATVLGPSGCGKSTLLRTIAGLERPDAGLVQLDGETVPADRPPERRGVGMMFQQPVLFPHLDVFENVAFPLRVRGVASRQVAEEVAAMLETFGLAGFGSAAATELSGGQMQRVALARALVFQPSVLLLDEPLGALERPLRERLQRELKEMQRRTGALFLMVTHDREEAMAVSDLMLIMDQGRVQQSGTPLEIWNRPASAFVARFLLYGAVLRGKVEPDGDGWCVRTPDGLLLHRGSGPPLEARELEVAIRADQVRLCPGNDVGEGEVPCVGKVTDIRFAGPTALITVAVGGSEIKASIASHDVPLLGAEGDTRFAFDCSRTLVFDEDGR